MGNEKRLLLTRKQLSDFLPDHESIKQFERLFATVDKIADNGVEELAFVANQGLSNSQLALALLKRLSDAIVRIELAPTVDPANIVHRYGVEKIPGDKTLTGLVNVDEIRFVSGVTPANTLGTTYWDDAEHTLSTIMDPTNGVVLQHGTEVYIRCVNKTGAPILNGKVVYISGAQGNRPKCALAKADNITTSTVIGVATQDIADNSEGFVTILGDVHGVDTTGFVDGDPLYLSDATAGLLTKVAPTSPNYVAPVAVALNSTVNGTISVHPHWALAADNAMTADTDLASPTQKAVKAYVTTALGSYVPITRTISTTAPLTGGGDLSANRTFAIPAATEVVDGYLSASAQNIGGAKTYSAIGTYTLATSTAALTAADEAIHLGPSTVATSNITHKCSPFFKIMGAIWNGAVNTSRGFTAQVVGISGTDFGYTLTIRSTDTADILKIVGNGGASTFGCTTDASSLTVASVILTGGLAVAKKAFIGDVLVLPKTTNKGIQVDTTTPTFPWRDIIGDVTPKTTGAGTPVSGAYQGNIYAMKFIANDVVDCIFHIPHDYVPGTDIHLHVHWSHNGTAITGNAVFTHYSTYAKGHNQANFPAEVTSTITYNTTNIATTPQYRHRIDEIALSTAGGSAALLNTTNLEPDGIILVRLKLTTLPTITAGDLFIHTIDIHYQSTNIGTKAKAPSFYT
jgi:hypothetical protein